MKTIEIEIDGEMVQANVYESMWEYAGEWNITHYELDPHEDEGEKVVGAWKPVEDVDFCVQNHGDSIEVEGRACLWVNAGEESVSLIPADELEYEFWTIYERVEQREYSAHYSCTGQIFQTREEAETEVA